MLFALLLPILLGMTALAIDVGGYASERRHLQNAADSMALAASQDLPDAAASQAAARSWAAKNGVDWSRVTFTVTQAGGGVLNPRVSIEIDKPHKFAFIRVLGIASKNVGAHAAAIKTSPGGIGGLVPWSVLLSTQLAAPPGESLTLKYDANNATAGNFGAIALDGTGSAIYLATTEHGSTSVVCAEGVPDCTTVSAECEEATCPTETGNKVGPTRDGIDYRIEHTDPSCSTFEQVFDGPADGKFHLDALCNPWLAGSKSSLRVVLVPVIDSLCNGRCDVTVVGFAMFFLEGYGAGGCTGNDCEVKGRFVNADLTINALTGVYDPDSSLHFTRLTE